MDHLKGISDLSNALTVFGWQMPDSYWRHRFLKNIIFEYGDLLCHDIDWEYLYFAVMRLMNTSYGLPGRRRFIRLLEDALYNPRERPLGRRKNPKARR